MVSRFLCGPAGRAMQLLGVALVSTAVCVGLYCAAVLRAAPQHDMPSSFKWLLLQDTGYAPRIIIEGGSSGHHGIDTDLVAQSLGITAINIADNAGYDLTDKVARLERFARPGDTVVMQLEWSYYLRDSVTDDYLSVLFGALPDYLTTLSTPDLVRRAMTVPAPVLWSAYHAVPPNQPVSTRAQQLAIAALQGASGHVSFAAARAPAAGVTEQSCDSYLFSAALSPENPQPSPQFLAALQRLSGLKSRGVKVLFAWPIVAGDDCYTSDIGLPQVQDRVQTAVQSAGFSFLGSMMDTRFAGNLRDDTPYHLITAGATRRTEMLISALRAQGVVGSGAIDLAALMQADILAREVRMPAPAMLVPLPLTAPYDLAAAPEQQIRFSAGWWQDEPSGRWMRGTEAVLTVALDPNLAPDQDLTLTGFTFNGQARQLVVFHDGQVLGQGQVAGAFALPVTTAAVPRGRPVQLVLRLKDEGPVQSPADLGLGEDVRSLTLHLRSLSLAAPVGLDPAEATPQPTAALAVAVAAAAQCPGVVADLPDATPCGPVQAAAVCQIPPQLASDAAVSDPESDARILFSAAPLDPQVRLTGGWWDAEAGGRWIGAQDAAMTVHPVAGAMGLRLTATPFNAQTMPVEISTDGTVLFRGDLVAGRPIEMTLPAALVGQDVTLRLHFPDVTPHCPSSLGLGQDTRDLLAFVTQIEFFAAASGI